MNRALINLTERCFHIQQTTHNHNSQLMELILFSINIVLQVDVDVGRNLGANVFAAEAQRQPHQSEAQTGEDHDPQSMSIAPLVGKAGCSKSVLIYTGHSGKCGCAFWESSEECRCIVRRDSSSNCSSWDCRCCTGLLSVGEDRGVLGL